jgi:hypothetical protein
MADTMEKRDEDRKQSRRKRRTRPSTLMGRRRAMQAAAGAMLPGRTSRRVDKRKADNFFKVLVGE